MPNWLRDFPKPRNKHSRLYALQARLERQIARAKKMERAEDTRRKIQLGGLVVKAGLDDLASNEMLGALLEIKDLIEGPESERNLRRFMRRGRAVFEEDERVKDEKRSKSQTKKRGDFDV